MIEVLITMVVLAIGILGLAGLVVKMNQAEAESYQRSQALTLLQEMSGRLALAAISAGASESTTLTVDPYLTTPATPLGYGNTQYNATCTDSGGNALTGTELDRCNWSNHLNGAAEVIGGNKVGAMIGARGCVEQLQAMDPSGGVCLPGIYRVSVVWQGLAATAAPPSGVLCGKNATWYPNDAMRRAISTTITVGLPRCM